MKSRDSALKINKRTMRTNEKDSRKGKEMTTVRFAYCLNRECRYESLVEYEYEEWFGFMRSFKVSQRQRRTVDLEL